MDSKQHSRLTVTEDEGLGNQMISRRLVARIDLEVLLLDVSDVSDEGPEPIMVPLESYCRCLLERKCPALGLRIARSSLCQQPRSREHHCLLVC